MKVKYAVLAFCLGLFFFCYLLVFGGPQDEG